MSPRVSTPDDDIRCPYCLATFHHDQVHFLCRNVSKVQLATTAESQQLLAADTPEEGTAQTKNATTANPKKTKEECFQRRANDPYLDKFWNDLGGKARYENYRYDNDAARIGGNFHWDNPVVTPSAEDKETMTLEGKGYEKNAQGFVYQIHDSYGASKDSARSTIRLCPKCHNPLCTGFGFYPAIFIALPGITSSGKSVFCYSLFDTVAFSDQLDRMGLDCLDNLEDCRRQIDSNCAGIGPTFDLPDSTDNSYFQRPICIRVRERTGDQNTYHLVLYDVAGENTRDPDLIQRFANYITIADAFLYLIDPNQFEPFRAAVNATETDVSSPYTILNTLEKLQETNKDCNFAPRPMAAVISKVDLYKAPEIPANWIDKTGPIYTPADLNTRLTQDALIMRSGIAEQLMYAQNPTFCRVLSNRFENPGYFCMSTLGCGTRWVLHTEDKNTPRYYLSTKMAAPLVAIRKHLAAPENSNEQYYFSICYLSKPEEYSAKIEACDTPPATGTYLLVESTGISLCEMGKTAEQLVFASRPLNMPHPLHITDPLCFLLHQLGIGEIPES